MTAYAILVGMDPLSHLVMTRILVGKERSVLIAGLAPDIPFYSTYLPWLIASRQLLPAIRQNSWPDPPTWMYVPHHISHSLFVMSSLALILRWTTGQWPRWIGAWLLHILVDIPTHAQRYWAPQFLWPCSRITVDGLSWPTMLIAWLQRMRQ